MTISVSQTSFVGGEWAPSLYARSDLSKYMTAVRTMKNFFPHPHGGASNRGGTQFIVETKDSSKASRLIPFQFSVVQSYVLEVGDQYMRVVADGGQVVGAAGNGLSIANSTYQWTASGSGTNEFYLEISGGGDPSVDEPATVYENASEMTEGTMGSLSAGEWDWGDNDTLGYDTVYVRLTDSADPDSKADGYVEAGAVADGAVFELTLPYVEADISLLKYTQSADVLYVFHPSYAPRKINRYNHAYWTVTAISYAPNISAPTHSGGTGSTYSYVVTAVDENGEESIASNVVTVAPGNAQTWSAVTGAEYYNVYKDKYGSGTFGWIGQANSTSFTEPAAGIDPDYDTTPPTAKDPFASADNYPGVGTFFEQRLITARTNNDPQKLWGSVVGSFENMNRSSPLRDDDAYNFTINALQVNEIRWLVPLNELIIGTSGSEWKMSNGANTDSVTPTSVNMRMQSLYGVSDLQPIVIGSSILFVEGSKNVVRDLTYSLEVDSYAGNDLSIMANHLFRNYEIDDWCYQQNPDSIIWCVRNDGALIGLTYFREHEVWGWHRHETDGDFESVTCISTDEGVDEVYMIVERTIDGSTKRYVERFMPRLPANSSFENEVEDAYFVDCGLSLDVPIDITGATKADPVVITATSHGFSDGDYVDVTEVVGMTELNGNRYRVGVVNANSFKLEQKTPSSIRNSTYKWTASGSGTNEYYLELTDGGDPSVDEPVNVYEDSTAMTIGTMGSLSAGEWDYGDNDTLGYNTIYVRLTDSADPDDKVSGYLKMGLTLDGSAYTTYVSGGKVRKAVLSLSGLSHLEGKSVAVLANGNVVTGLTVSSGAITLTERASRVHVGIGYTSDLETLDYEYPTETGTVQDKIRNISSVVARLENTRAMWVGPDENNLDEVWFREDENYDEATGLYTGDKEMSIETGEPREARLFIRNTDPLPITILALIVRMSHGER